MKKIAQVHINLDKSVKDDNRTTYKCGSVVSLNSYGEPLKNYDEMLSGDEYRSKHELILNIAYKIGVDTSAITILN